MVDVALMIVGFVACSHGVDLWPRLETIAAIWAVSRVVPRFAAGEAVVVTLVIGGDGVLGEELIFVEIVLPDSIGVGVASSILVGAVPNWFGEWGSWYSLLVARLLSRGISFAFILELVSLPMGTLLFELSCEHLVD